MCALLKPFVSIHNTTKNMFLLPLNRRSVLTGLGPSLWAAQVVPCSFSHSPQVTIFREIENQQIPYDSTAFMSALNILGYQRRKGRGFFTRLGLEQRELDSAKNRPFSLTPATRK